MHGDIKILSVVYVLVFSYKREKELQLFYNRYGVSPFEYALGESGGSLQLAAMSGQIRWPSGPKKPYQDSLHRFVTWMLKPQVELRPTIDDVIIHIDKVLAKFS